MSDLISRQAAIDAIQNDVEPFVIVEPGTTCVIGAGVKDADVIAVLEALPSAEPGRKKGKWIYGEHDVAMCDGYRCDKCGFFVPWDYQHKSIDFIKDYNYCPSCGADMRGRGDSE